MQIVLYRSYALLYGTRYYWLDRKDASMFSWLRRKQPPSVSLPILELDDHSFVRAVLASQEGQPPGAGAMCVVAYLNLTPMIGASFEVARETGDSKVPSTLDDFIRLIATTLATKTDEIEKRRLMWLFQAALIMRATQKSETSPLLLDDTAQIWVHLVKGGAVIDGALRDNILWSDEEKEYFSSIHDETSGMEYVVNHVVPRHLRKHSIIQKLASDHELSVCLSL